MWRQAFTPAASKPLASRVCPASWLGHLTLSGELASPSLSALAHDSRSAIEMQSSVASHNDRQQLEPPESAGEQTVGVIQCLHRITENTYAINHPMVILHTIVGRSYCLTVCLWGKYVVGRHRQAYLRVTSGLKPKERGRNRDANKHSCQALCSFLSHAWFYESHSCSEAVRNVDFFDQESVESNPLTESTDSR